MLRVIADFVSRGGTRATLTILIYHRTLAAPDPILHDEIDAKTFESHMAVLRRDFNVLPLSEACRRLSLRSLPPRAVCVTFDDGYADSERVALPILKRLGLTAAFFVATGYLDGGVMFNDAVIETVRHAPDGEHDLSMFGVGTRRLDDARSRRQAIDALIGQMKYRPPVERQALVDDLVATLRSTPVRDLMMRPEQIRRLHDAGMDIGAHTVSHPILASLDEGEARAEIILSKRQLEDITGSPVELFAYPNGKPSIDYRARDVALVRQAGFAAAVSTVRGVADRASDPFQLPRFGPWDQSPGRFGARLFLNAMRRSPRGHESQVLQ